MDALEVGTLETAETGVEVGVLVLDAHFVAVHSWFVCRADQENHSAAGQFVQGKSVI